MNFFKKAKLKRAEKDHNRKKEIDNILNGDGFKLMTIYQREEIRSFLLRGGRK